MIDEIESPIKHSPRKYSALTQSHEKNDKHEEQIDAAQPQIKNLMSLDDDYEQKLQKVPSVSDFQSPNLNDHHLVQSSNMILEKEPQTTPETQIKVLNLRRRTDKKYRNDSDYSQESVEPKQQYCNCTKTGCLKLYCQCFHRNQECSSKCKCENCSNNAQNSDVRRKALERVKRKAQRSVHDEDLFDTRKVWGCNCQKSRCLKNYCECYNRSQKCTSNCKCEDCQNKRKPKQNQQKKIKH